MATCTSRASQSLVAGLVLSVLSARALQLHGRGEFAALATAASVMVQIVNLGLSSSLVVLFSRRPRRVARYAKVLWAIPLLSGALVSVFGLLSRQLDPESPSPTSGPCWRSGSRSSS